MIDRIKEEALRMLKHFCDGVGDLPDDSDYQLLTLKASYLSQLSLSSALLKGAGISGQDAFRIGEDLLKVAVVELSNRDSEDDHGSH